MQKFNDFIKLLKKEQACIDWYNFFFEKKPWGRPRKLPDSKLTPEENDKREKKNSEISCNFCEATLSLDIENIKNWLAC